MSAHGAPDAGKLALSASIPEMVDDVAKAMQQYASDRKATMTKMKPTIDEVQQGLPRRAKDFGEQQRVVPTDEAGRVYVHSGPTHYAGGFRAFYRVTSRYPHGPIRVQAIEHECVLTAHGDDVHLGQNYHVPKLDEQGHTIPTTGFFKDENVGEPVINNTGAVTAIELPKSYTTVKDKLVPWDGRVQMHWWDD